MAAGYRSREGFWVGGLSVPTQRHGGYRSKVAFWIGGLSSVPTIVLPPPPPITPYAGGGSARWYLPHKKDGKLYEDKKDRKLYEDEELLIILAVINQC